MTLMKRMISIKKKKEIEVLQEKIEELHVKFKKYENIDDDFSREIN